MSIIEIIGNLIMFMQTVKISSKGQLVLPKKVRNILGNSVISIKVDDNNQITLTSVRNLAGSLLSYKKDLSLSFEDIRNEAWKDNIKVNDKQNGKHK